MNRESRLGVVLTISVVSVMLFLTFSQYYYSEEYDNRYDIVKLTLTLHPSVNDYVFKESQESMKNWNKVFVHDMVTYIGATDEQSEVVQSLIDRFGDKELASIIYNLTEEKYGVQEKCRFC